MPVVVHESPEEVRQAVRARLAVYPHLPHYQRMFADAGFPEAAQGQWTDEMIAAVVIYGDEEAVARRMAGLFDMGIGEVMAHPVPAGPDPDASRARILKAIARMSREL